MWVLINSNIKNNIASKKLIDSIPKEISMLLVEGGHTETRIEINYVKSVINVHLFVEHNSIDFTAVIALLENEEELKAKFDLPKMWFYIHDTCEIVDSKLFLECLNKEYTQSYSLCKPPSMNIGIFLHNDFLEHKEELLKFKSSTSPSIQEINHLKQLGVIKEDFIAKKKNLSFLDTRITKSEYFYYPGSSVKRIQEYYKNVGLVKYKANWNVKKNYELNI